MPLLTLGLAIDPKLSLSQAFRILLFSLGLKGCQYVKLPCPPLRNIRQRRKKGIQQLFCNTNHLPEGKTQDRKEKGFGYWWQQFQRDNTITGSTPNSLLTNVCFVFVPSRTWYVPSTSKFLLNMSEWMLG